MNEYRELDEYELDDIVDSRIDKEKFVLSSDFNDRIDDIESDVNEILDLLKNYELSGAMEKLEEISNKLY